PCRGADDRSGVHGDRRMRHIQPLLQVHGTDLRGREVLRPAVERPRPAARAVHEEQRSHAPRVPYASASATVVRAARTNAASTNEPSPSAYAPTPPSSWAVKPATSARARSTSASVGRYTASIV